MMFRIADLILPKEQIIIRLDRFSNTRHRHVNGAWVERSRDLASPLALRYIEPFHCICLFINLHSKQSPIKINCRAFSNEVTAASHLVVSLAALN